MSSSAAEADRLNEQSVPPHKPAQVGPQIAAKLTGAARRYGTGQPAHWLSYHGGADRLLEYLRQGLDQPSFMEVTEHLNEYLKANRRRTGESINEYLARKNEIYLRAQHALQRRSTSSNHKSQAQHGSLLPGGIDLQRTHVEPPDLDGVAAGT